jgi:hypothetical protein
MGTHHRLSWNQQTATLWSAAHPNILFRIEGWDYPDGPRYRVEGNGRPMGAAPTLDAAKDIAQAYVNSL